jgi:hypothetical protein
MLPLQLNEWMELSRPNGYVDVMVNPAAKERFTRAVKDAGIETTLMIRDVEDIIKRHAVREKRSASSEITDGEHRATFLAFGNWKVFRS